MASRQRSQCGLVAKSACDIRDVLAVYRLSAGKYWLSLGGRVAESGDSVVPIITIYGSVLQTQQNVICCVIVEQKLTRPVRSIESILSFE